MPKQRRRSFAARIAAPFKRLKLITDMVFGGSRPLAFGLPNTAVNYERSVGRGDRSSVVMAPVGWIARNFIEARLALVRDGELELEGGMLDLIRRPNKFYTGIDLWKATVMSLKLDGNAYWAVVRNQFTLQPVELWWIPFYLIEPRGSATEFVTHYEYRVGAATQQLMPGDLVHFRNGLDPDEPRKGLSPLKSLFREIFTDDEASNYTAALLHNSGVPGLIISPDGDDTIPDEDLDDTKEYIKQHYVGDRRGEPLVLSSSTKVERVGFTPAELDLGHLRNVPEERVTAVLGVPAAVVGLGTGVQQTKVGATMKELREEAYEGSIIPEQTQVAEHLRNQLLPDFEPDVAGIEVVFDLSQVRVLTEDQDRLSTRTLAEVAGGLITVAEGRQILGHDTDPEHDVYLRDANLVAVPQGTSPEEQAAARAPAAIDTGAASSAGDGLKQDEPNAAWDALDRPVRAITQQGVDEVERVFDEVERRVKEELGNF